MYVTERIFERILLIVGLCLATLGASAALAQQVTDPGVRAAATDGGPPVPLSGTSPNEMGYFLDGAARFADGRGGVGRDEYRSGYAG